MLRGLVPPRPARQYTPDLLEFATGRPRQRRQRQVPDQPAERYGQVDAGRDQQRHPSGCEVIRKSLGNRSGLLKKSSGLQSVVPVNTRRYQMLCKQSTLSTAPVV